MRQNTKESDPTWTVTIKKLQKRALDSKKEQKIQVRSSMLESEPKLFSLIIIRIIFKKAIEVYMSSLNNFINLSQCKIIFKTIKNNSLISKSKPLVNPKTI